MVPGFSLLFEFETGGSVYLTITITSLRFGENGRLMRADAKHVRVCGLLYVKLVRVYKPSSFMHWMERPLWHFVLEYFPLYGLKLEAVGVFCTRAIDLFLKCVIVLTI